MMNIRCLWLKLIFKNYGSSSCNTVIFRNWLTRSITSYRQNDRLHLKFSDSEWVRVMSLCTCSLCHFSCYHGAEWEILWVCDLNLFKEKVFLSLQNRLFHKHFTHEIKFLVITYCYVEEYSDSDPCGLITDLQPLNTNVEMDCAIGVTWLKIVRRDVCDIAVKCNIVN